MAANLTPTGGALGSNVYNFSTARAAATVVDGILNYPMLASRLMYKAREFSGDGRGEQPTIIKTIKVSGRSQFQWFDSLDALNSSAENVVIQLQFNDAHATMPMVEIMTDSFAREGDGEDIDYPAFEYEDALNETVEGLSIAAFGVGGSGDEPLGLEGIVDAGTNLATYGGQTRATYDSLDATVTASGGAMTLAKLATLRSTISDSGPKESPTLIAASDTIANLYEQFLTPTVSREYKTMSMTGAFPVATESPSMGQGFGGVNTYSGIPIIRDKRSTSGVLYMLNENYLHWYGRTRVPKNFKEFVSPVSLGKSKVVEGQASESPSKYHGFFYQAKQMMPNQAGIISRFYVFGQMASFQPRRQGKLTGITSVS
ncbi:MAG: phage major capsid protein [Candidatus Berkelbacteria bacterium]|nr:phage major capsid protein [Candidatus Berkelbacteria bacterium]